MRRTEKYEGQMVPARAPAIKQEENKNSNPINDEQETSKPIPGFVI